MAGFDKSNLQTLGLALIGLGLFLFWLGIIGNPPTKYYPGDMLPWYYGLRVASLLFGPAPIIIGIILLILARGMKPEQALK